jgi:hypothetical protein
MSSHPLFPEGWRRPERPPEPEPEPPPPPKTPFYRQPYFLPITGAVLLVLLGSAWWYFFGPNPVTAADLVPGDTLVLLAIPNGTALAAGYPGSHLHNLISSPNAQPALGAVGAALGPRNLDLLEAFAPNLSGQSFVAVTPAPAGGHLGVIAAFRPKPGLGNFDAFVSKLRADYPDFLNEVAVGSGEVDGVAYQSLQHSATGDKVCVAQLGGWVVTTWGEAPLADWIARYRGETPSPSLAQNPDYQKVRARIGRDADALVYLDGRGAAAALNQLLPGAPRPALDNLPAGAVGIGSRFQDGDIVDRYALLGAKPPQPCAFETLKFTGPDTRLYWARTIDWSTWANPDPKVDSLAGRLKSWGESHGIDWQKNVIDALGGEFSLQGEWTDDADWPEAGIFVKLSNPDAFKPVIQAIIDTVRTTYGQQGYIGEFASEDQHFATFKMTNGFPAHPTVTEGGDYFGLFTNDNFALHSYQRDTVGTIDHNDDFGRLIGDRRSGASEVVFLNAAPVLNRAYQKALPYVPMAAMISPSLAARLQSVQLPPDLSWLMPMGSWGLVTTPTPEGQFSVSESGIGNQGILFGSLISAGSYLFTRHSPEPPESAPAPVTTPATDTNTMAAPTPAPPADTNAAAATPVPATATDTNTMAAPTPDTNAATLPVPPATNAAPQPVIPSAIGASAPADSTSAPHADTSTNPPAATPAPDH